MVVEARGGGRAAGSGALGEPERRGRQALSIEGSSLEKYALRACTRSGMDGERDCCPALCAPPNTISPLSPPGPLADLKAEERQSMFCTEPSAGGSRDSDASAPAKSGGLTATVDASQPSCSSMSACAALCAAAGKSALSSLASSAMTAPKALLR